jgi:hypothetical protein
MDIRRQPVVSVQGIEPGTVCSCRKRLAARLGPDHAQLLDGGGMTATAITIKRLTRGEFARGGERRHQCKTLDDCRQKDAHEVQFSRDPTEKSFGTLGSRHLIAG